MDYTLFVTGKGIGKGNEILAEKLMYSYFYSLSEGDDLPTHVLFLNEGVRLTTEDTPLIQILQKLADRGVTLYSCGICLDYYNVTNELKVGEIGNMYLNMELMAKTNKVITLG